MPNPFDDYIASLEGKTEIDPLEVVRDLHGIYNADIGIREAKIEELTGTIAEKDTSYSQTEAELQRQKAINYDLAMQIPANGGSQAQNDENKDEKPDGHAIRTDDLFTSRKRR